MSAAETGSFGARDITGNFSVLYAPVGEHEAQALFAGTANVRFEPLEPPTSINRTGQEAWLRTTLPPYDAEQPSDVLEIPGQIFNYVDIWFRLPDGSITHYYAGDAYPYNERAIKHSTIAFPVPAAAEGEVEVLIRARNETSHRMNFAALVWSSVQWDAYLLAKRLWYGFFLGAILALCLYNTFLAGTLRDASYLYYVGYVLCISASVILLSGLAEEYLWPEGKPAPLVLAVTGVGTFLAVGFVNRFLRVRQSYPGVFWLSTAVAGLAMVLGLVLVRSHKLPLLPQEYSASVIHGLMLVAGVYFIGMSLFSYLRGVIHARFLALSMLLLLGSIVCYFSYTYGFISYNLFVGHFLEVGVLAEGMLLSLALADRINLLTQEKREAERAALDAQVSFSRRLIRAQEEERQSLSETMHDSIGHAMLVLKNNLQRGVDTLPPAAVNGTGELRELLREQVDYCGEIMNEVRGISHDLHPHMLERLGLAAAIESTMARALDPLGIQWVAEVDPACNDIDPDLQSTIYRALQECLNNIMKYAQAGAVSCEVICGEQSVKCCVFDDGVGFEGEHASSNGMGLAEMAGRVEVVGGSLQLESTPGEGTMVQFEVPLAMPGGSREASP